MTIGWETNKQEGANRMKIDLEGEISEFNFWEGVSAVRSELSSELPFTLKDTSEINTFKVISVTKTARYDKITGNNKETVYIYGDWRECTPKIGNTISVMDCLCCKQGIDSDDLNIVTNHTNYLIIHSKRSLIATNIIQSLECIRKGMLMERVAQYSRTVTKPLVHGIVIHEWVDYLVKNRKGTITDLAGELKKIIKRYTIELYRIGETEEKTFAEVFKHFHALKGFIGSLEYTESKESKTVHSKNLQIKGKPDIVIVKNQKETEIELKTGEKLQTENIAQVILYGLLQKGTKGYTSQHLFHLKSKKSQEVTLNHSEIVYILIRKNRMVREKDLPPRKVITHCDNCHLNSICSDVSKIEGSIRDIKISQGSPYEHTQTKKTQSGMDLLLSLSLDRIELFGYLWERIDEEEEKSTEPILEGAVEAWDNNLLKVTISEKKTKILFPGDFISVYDENICLFGRGIISTVDKTVLEIHMHERLLYTQNRSIYLSKDSCLKMFSEIRSSLLYLFTTEKIRSRWLSSIKVSPSPIPCEFTREYSELNPDQQSALSNSLSSHPYALIHGMPGTGKTRVIALLTRILVSQGKRVLITCFTHLALNNLEKRLEIDKKAKIYRTGNTVKTFTEKPEKIGEVFDSFNIILSTARAVYKDPIFTSKEFDVLISDEATQQNFLLSVIPTMICRSFILVGDHLQLSPLSKTEAMGVSLFDLLRQRASVINTLTIQYRMKQSIMAVANKMFYNEQMKCHRKELDRAGRVVFIDTRTEEAEQIVKGLKGSVQILCYFNEQVRNVRELGKEAETVDRFQGSESDEIVLIIDLFLKGSPKIDILISKERLNVGITRAKSSLILLGNVDFLKRFPLFELLFRNIEIEKYQTGRI